MCEPSRAAEPDPVPSEEGVALPAPVPGLEGADDAVSSEEHSLGEHSVVPVDPESSDRAGAAAAAPGDAGDVAESPEPPPIPAICDVFDLDWAAVGDAVDPAVIRARIRPIVEAMETLLDRAGGPGMLFDADRADGRDQAFQVSAPVDAPLWFIGDLHGDLLALEASLRLIDAEKGTGMSPRIVLLGDLFDDEGLGLEVLLRVFELILQEPGHVCLIAGNHDEALSFDGVRFTSTVNPSDFTDFLNANLAHEWIERAGKLAVRLFAQAPRALFFSDGLLAAHAGFPLADLHSKLAETADWNDPACLADFVWTRAHPTARKKLPNRYGRGSQYGYEDFAAFCALSAKLGRPVSHMVRGHDHVDERYAIYPAYRAHPVLTTVALSRRLAREGFGSYERAPSLARFVQGALPQVYRLHIPAELVREIYPIPQSAEIEAALPEESTI
jgi:hypothetical protein